MILREVQVPAPGQSLRASLGIGEPRDRLWPIHAEHGVTCQGVWICSGAVRGSHKYQKWTSYDSHVSWVEEELEPTNRASDICDKVVAIGWKEMTGPEVLEVDG